MDLVTRCPQCGTTFSASLEQLQLRKGYIRCVNCAHIFDGYEAVVPSAEAAAPAVPAPAPALETPAEAPPHVLRKPPKRYGVSNTAQSGAQLAQSASPFTISESTSSPAAVEPVLGTAAARPAQPEPRLSLKPSVALRPEPSIGAGYERPSASGRAEPVMAESGPMADEPASAHVGALYVEPRQVEPDRPAPDFLGEDTQDRGWSGSLWTVLVGTGLLALAAQMVYLYRVQVATAAPWTRPALERVCVSLNCSVDYPRRIDHIAIMSSSLQAESGQDLDSQDRRLILSVVLRNSLDHPQEWPTLTLDLVDVAGSPVARRVLTPEQYLPARAGQSPFAAQSEMHLSLPVTVSGTQINGYQLGKYFP